MRPLFLYLNYVFKVRARRENNDRFRAGRSCVFPTSPQIPGLPQLHDRHVPPQPPGVPHLHLLPPQPDGGRLRRHEVGVSARALWLSVVVTAADNNNKQNINIDVIL